MYLSNLSHFTLVKEWFEFAILHEVFLRLRFMRFHRTRACIVHWLERWLTISTRSSYCLLSLCGSDTAWFPICGPRRQRPGGQCEGKGTPTGVSPPRWGAPPAGEEPGPEDQRAHGWGRHWRRRGWRGLRGWGRGWRCVRRHTPILPPWQANKPAKHGSAVRRGVQSLQRLSILL